jgi:PAS domain S-box-containing protein
MGKKKKQPVSIKYQALADQTIGRLLGLFLVFAVISGFYTSHVWAALGMGVFFFGLYFTIVTQLSSHYLKNYLLAVLPVGFFTYLLLVSGNQLWVLPFYFILLGALLLYRKWQIIVLSGLLGLMGIALFWELGDGFPRFGSTHLLFMTISAIYLGAMVWLAKKWSRYEQKSEGQIAAHEVTLQFIQKNIRFANSLAGGDLRVSYEAEAGDELGKALIEMRNSLLEAREREEKEKYINVGLAKIGEILRTNVDDISKLGDEIIEMLVDYMKANQGGIFILQEEESEEPYLELVAARAFARKKYIERKIYMGEGLVGQSAIEGEIIFMTEVPNDYIAITSGLGSANPRSVLIVPLKTNDQVMGVVELASFQVFDQSDIEFLEKVGESIASTIISAKINRKTKLLLDQSTEMTEQLRAQEEEMRQNMEEMQATQEEMHRAQNQLKKQTEELAVKESNLNALINNTDDSIITIDRDYRVTVVNDVVKRRYKGTEFEGIDVGANALDMLGSVRDEWKGYYDRALAGEKLNFEIKSSVKGEDSFREYFINPISDAHGRVMGVSIFSRDVTEKISALNRMHEKDMVLHAMINSTRDTYFAIDKQYRILVANDVIRNRFLQTGIELKEGDNILQLLPAESAEMWKEHYDRALQGEAYHFEQERKVGDQTLFLEVYCNPVMKEDMEIIGASVISIDITDRKGAQKEVEKLLQEVAQLRGSSQK